MHILSICTTYSRPNLGPMLKNRADCTFVYFQLHTLINKWVVYFGLFNVIAQNISTSGKCMKMCANSEKISLNLHFME